MKLFALSILLLLATTAPGHSETMSKSPQTSTTSDGTTRISGQVMVTKKTPMVNGVVLLYNKNMGPPPHPYKYWRIPDSISSTDKKGKFSLEVPEGTYYLMVAQKQASGEIGPPRESEYLYFHGDAKGNAIPITAVAGKKLNLGVLSKSQVWSPKMVPHDKDITAIEGIITDRDGKPVEGTIAFAYFSSNAVGRPAFISDKTSTDGKYQLRVYEGATYYLKVRSVIGGGAPEPGEFQNTTKGFEPVEVTLKTGQILKDVELKVDRFSGKGVNGPEKPPKIWGNIGK